MATQRRTGRSTTKAARAAPSAPKTRGDRARSALEQNQSKSKSHPAAIDPLQQSERFARSILEASTNAVEVLDLDGGLIFMNGPGLKLMEVDDITPILHRPFSSFWPDDWKATIETALDRARAGETARFTAFGPTAKGTPKWWDVSTAPIRDDSGR